MRLPVACGDMRSTEIGARPGRLADRPASGSHPLRHFFRRRDQGGFPIDPELLNMQKDFVTSWEDDPLLPDLLFVGGKRRLGEKFFSPKSAIVSF